MPAAVRSLTRRSGKFTALVGGAILAAAVGCNTSGMYPVAGKVVDEAGQPIPGLADSNYLMFSQTGEGTSSSMAEIEADGSFRIFTMKPYDGAEPTEYNVYLPRKYLDPERQAPQVIDGQYEDIGRSPLSAKVEPKRNYFEFKVKRLRRRGS